MLSLLHSTSRELAARKIPHALIGAAAMAAHGAVRATDDVDLLVNERTVLRPEFWETLRQQGVTVEARVGDDTDPLAGVVRLSLRSETVDVVVGRQAWITSILERATPLQIGAELVPVVSVPDLIVLKVYAGAARDLYDVEELLDLGNRRTIQAAVDREIGRLPREARHRWQSMTRSRDRGR